jgi:hypothetical protein
MTTYQVQLYKDVNIHGADTDDNKEKHPCHSLPPL